MLRSNGAAAFATVPGACSGVEATEMYNMQLTVIWQLVPLPCLVNYVQQLWVRYLSVVHVVGHAAAFLVFGCCLTTVFVGVGGLLGEGWSVGDCRMRTTARSPMLWSITTSPDYSNEAVDQLSSVPFR